MGKEMIDVSFSRIGGEVQAPSSKSFMQRYVLLSSFLDGTMRIYNPGFSEDDRVSTGIAESCGKKISGNREVMVIDGIFKRPESINVGESGTSFRLVQGLLASSHSRTRIYYKKSLATRPMEPLINALSPHGYSYLTEGDSVLIDASHFDCPDSFEIDGTVSSQFISSLMFCLALGKKENGIIKVRNGLSSEGYIKITSRILEDFGCKVFTNREVKVDSRNMKMPERATIEGDYSSSAFLIVMGLLLSEQGITVKGLPARTFQPDSQIMEILGKYLEVRRYGDLMDVTASRQETGRIVMDVNRTPDLAPPLSVLGMFSMEGIEIRNPQRLRTKESDRLAAIIDLADSTGARVEMEEDAMIIRKGDQVKISDLPERDDHRIVMAKFLASAVMRERFQIHFHDSVNKSFPEFWNYASKLGFSIDFK